VLVLGLFGDEGLEAAAAEVVDAELSLSAPPTPPPPEAVTAEAAGATPPPLPLPLLLLSAVLSPVLLCFVCCTKGHGKVRMFPFAVPQ
jgi:hypothetical protein